MQFRSARSEAMFSPNRRQPMSAPQSRTALVIGATGGFGRNTADALIAHGWRVRGLQRNPDAARAANPAAIEWRKGDAMVREDVLAAADGVSAIVHAVNPPGYKN